MIAPDKLFQLMNVRTLIFMRQKRGKNSFSRQTVPTYELKDSDIYEAGKKEKKNDSLTRDKRNFPDLVGY